MKEPYEDKLDADMEEESPYCEECEACGEDGCCSALMCAYKNMVDKSTGKYCEGYYWDLVIAYEVLKKLNEKQLDEIGYDKILDNVHKARKAHGREIKSWMRLSKREIIDLDDENWQHYKNGGCLCSAYCDCECVCGAWDNHENQFSDKTTEGNE